MLFHEAGHSTRLFTHTWIVLVRRSIPRYATRARKDLKRLGAAFVRAHKPFPLFVFGGRAAVGSVINCRYSCPLPELNFPIIWKTVEENIRFLQLFSASVGRTLVLFVDADGARFRQCTSFRIRDRFWEFNYAGKTREIFSGSVIETGVLGVAG